MNKEEAGGVNMKNANEDKFGKELVTNLAEARAKEKTDVTRVHKNGAINRKSSVANPELQAKYQEYKKDVLDYLNNNKSKKIKYPDRIEVHIANTSNMRLTRRSGLLFWLAVIASIPIFMWFVSFITRIGSTIHQ